MFFHFLSHAFGEELRFSLFAFEFAFAVGFGGFYGGAAVFGGAGGQGDGEGEECEEAEDEVFAVHSRRFFVFKKAFRAYI